MSTEAVNCYHYKQLFVSNFPNKPEHKQCSIMVTKFIREKEPINRQIQSEREINEIKEFALKIMTGQLNLESCECISSKCVNYGISTAQHLFFLLLRVDPESQMKVELIFFQMISLFLSLTFFEFQVFHIFNFFFRFFISFSSMSSIR